MSEIKVERIPCPHCGGLGYTEKKSKLVTKEEPIHTGYTLNGPNIEGTADELRAKGYRPSQMGWTNGPMGNTD